MDVSVASLSKSFGNLSVLQDVTFTIDPGSVACIIGSNGAGKTTLLRCLSGLLRPTSGSILYDQQAFTRRRLDLRRRFMFVREPPLVDPGRSPLEHIGMCLRLFEVERGGLDRRVLDLLHALDLAVCADIPLMTLSRGQQYKAAIAALLAVDAELWLLDEPFASGMDPNGLSLLKREIRDAATRGRTVLFSTQMLEMAERLADRVGILHQHRMAAFDSLEALLLPGSDLEALFQSFREKP